MPNQRSKQTAGRVSTQPSSASSSVPCLDQSLSTTRVQQEYCGITGAVQNGGRTRRTAVHRLSAGCKAMLVSVLNVLGFKSQGLQATKTDSCSVSPFQNSYDPQPLAALAAEEEACRRSQPCTTSLHANGGDGSATAAVPSSPNQAQSAAVPVHSNGSCSTPATPQQPFHHPQQQQQQLLLLPANANGSASSPGRQPPAVTLPDASGPFSSSAAMAPLPPQLVASLLAAAPVPRSPGSTHTTTSVRAIIASTPDAHAAGIRSVLAMNGAMSSCSSIGLDDDRPERSSSVNSLLSASSSRRASMLGDSGRASRRGSLVLDMGPPSPGPGDAESSPAPWWGRAWSFGAHHDQSLRDHMEDRTHMVDLSSHEAFVAAGVRRAGFFAVYDGHSGAEASEYLQSHLLSHVLRAPELLLEQPGAALAAAVETAEREIVAQFAASRCNAGSTLLAVLLLDNHLHVAHVGDCRAVLARGTEAMALTADHKPQSEAERARIEAIDPAATISSDGYIYGELAVSRAVGSQHLKLDPSKRALTHVPEVAFRVLEREDDFLVLATDGLWDKVDNAEAVATARRVLARERGAAEASAKALVERALNYKSGDNISVVVVCLHDRPISMPKTNSMLFRKLNAEGRCGTPNSSGGLDTPASCNTPAGVSTPVGGTTPRERNSDTPSTAPQPSADAGGSSALGSSSCSGAGGHSSNTGGSDKAAASQAALPDLGVQQSSCEGNGNNSSAGNSRQ